jgi:hypothetical protein
MRDAYDKLFAVYDRGVFFRNGIESIIYVTDAKKLKENWESQKRKLMNREELVIRGYGRNATNTLWFITLYSILFGNEKIKKDPNNNALPTKVLKDLTGLSKNAKGNQFDKEKIQNYQVSHLFGKTKNPLLFGAAWNIAYVPKYLDPFTGHEMQGGHRDEFQRIFFPIVKVKFTEFISDFNSFIDDKLSIHLLENALSITKEKCKINDEDFKRFKSDVEKEWAIIEE